MSAPKTLDGQVAKFGRKHATGWILGLCLTVFVGATIYAINQPPRPDPFKSATANEFLRYPYEENAFMRLPMITGNLNDVCVIPGSGYVIAVGDAGLIIMSRDGGRTWERSMNLAKETVPRMQVPGTPSIKLSEFNWMIKHANAADQPKSNSGRNTIIDVRQQSTGAIKSPVKDDSKKEQSPTKDAPTETAPDLSQIFFIDGSFGWIVGNGGTILKTIDGGRSWIHQDSGTDVRLLSICFTDRDYGWASGLDGTILATTNGGRQWYRQKNDAIGSLNAVYFLDRNIGWSAGYGGTLLTTDNGGRTWSPITTGTSSWFYCIHFSKPSNGWISGGDGTILATHDGGRNWNAQDSGTSASLYSIGFVDHEIGFAAGTGGVVVSTLNGGRDWRLMNSSTDAQLFSIQPLDRNAGWSVGEAGTILTLSDLGRDWVPLSTGIKAWFRSIHFTDREYGWAAGQDGKIFKTIDGGRTWDRTESQTTSQLDSIYFIDRQHGWACGEGGTILSTVDGGRNWKKAVVDKLAWLSAIHFINRDIGWACGAGGTILSTDDGGKTWRHLTGGIPNWYNDIYFMDRERGWVCDEMGRVLFTADGGKNWNNVVSMAYPRLNALTFSDSMHGWAAGQDGTILSTIDGGKRWRRQRGSSTGELSSIYFVDDQHGWVCGDNGTILSTFDGGQNWHKVQSGTMVGLQSLFFTDKQRGWACGDGSTILSTTDGGQSWKLPTYRRLPAPWYWVLCLSLILIALFAIQRRGQPEQAGETVADLLASDRPLEAGDPDPLDLRRISSGLARFIANRNTDPPLTLAVTGEWGTGKSSLMNLLYHDLKQRRFQPVWFNAWHHQKGEQLLASLYANIRQQAVPPLWHPSGILFRLRLLFQRGRRNRLAFGALAFLFFAAYPFLESVTLSLAGGMTHLVKALIARDMDSVRQLFSFADLTGFIPDNWIGALLASPAVAAVWKAIRAFGLSPQSLLAFGSADGGKRRGLDPGARARFAREFQDVASSLDLGAMVIFIDDLDRCSKENVVEILETINFLAVSGRCFIILGMARQWVETCVALQFKELAEETSNENNSRDDGYVHRRRFAKQYLEKLINIEVPVPVPSPEDARALLRPKTYDPTTRMEQILSIIGKVTRKYAPVACLAGLALLAWYLKDIFNAEPRQVKETTKQELMVLPASREEGELVLQDGSVRIPLNDIAGQQGNRSLEIVLKGQKNALETGIPIGTLGKEEQSAELVLRYRPEPVTKTTQQPADSSNNQLPRVSDDKQRGEASFRPGAEDTSRSGHWLALLAGLGLGVIGVLYLVQRPKRFTADSKTFRDALDIWHPWIVVVRRTPRTIKRFLNRLRYVAMRLRNEPERLSLWDRMKNRFTWKQSGQKTVETSEGVPEPVLVALGAIYHVNPDWVKNTDTLGELFLTNTEDLVQRLEKLYTESTENAERIIDIAVELTNAIMKYKKEFGQDLDDLVRHREAFLSVLAETGM